MLRGEQFKSQNRVSNQTTPSNLINVLLICILKLNLNPVVNQRKIQTYKRITYFKIEFKTETRVIYVNSLKYKFPEINYKSRVRNL